MIQHWQPVSCSLIWDIFRSFDIPQGTHVETNLNRQLKYGSFNLGHLQSGLVNHYSLLGVSATLECLGSCLKVGYYHTNLVDSIATPEFSYTVDLIVKIRSLSL